MEGGSGAADAPASHRFTVVSDGRWYFHVRALDRAGNWGMANHFMVVVDRSEPVVVGHRPRNSTVGFRTPVVCRYDDVALDPRSVRIELDGSAYDRSHSGLAVVPENQHIALDPSRIESGGPAHVPPQKRSQSYGLIFPDGATVHVRLLAASDYLGHVLQEPYSWSYTVRSPLKVVPPNPDGENGWYVTPPKMQVDWQAFGVIRPGVPLKEVNQEANKSRMAWSAPFTDPWSRQGSSVRELRLRAPPKREVGKDTQYRKLFKLDTHISYY